VSRWQSNALRDKSQEEAAPNDARKTTKWAARTARAVGAKRGGDVAATGAVAASKSW